MSNFTPDAIIYQNLIFQIRFLQIIASDIDLVKCVKTLEVEKVVKKAQMTLDFKNIIQFFFPCSFDVLLQSSTKRDETLLDFRRSQLSNSPTKLFPPHPLNQCCYRVEKPSTDTFLSLQHWFWGWGVEVISFICNQAFFKFCLNSFVDDCRVETNIYVVTLIHQKFLWLIH